MKHLYTLITSSVMAFSAGAVTADWLPETITTEVFNHVTGRYDSPITTVLTYTPTGQIASRTIESGSIRTRTEYEYTGSDLHASIIRVYSYWGENLSGIAEVNAQYDSRIESFMTNATLRSSTDGTTWSNPIIIRDVKVERDSRGNITLIDPVVLRDEYFGAADLSEIVDDDCWKLVVTYGSDGLPTSIVSEEMSGSTSGVPKSYDYMMKLTDCTWKECDGQITSLENITENNNKIATGKLSDSDGLTNTFEVDYKTDGSYVMTGKGMSEYGKEISMKFVLDILDSYGSRRETETTVYPGGRSQTSVTTTLYDSFGLLIEEKDTESVNNGPEEIDDWKKSEITYASDGTPAQVLLMDYDDDSGTMTPIIRTTYTGNASGIDAVGSDTDASVEYFTIEGIKVSDPSSLLPGMYIERRGRSSRKVIIH